MTITALDLAQKSFRRTLRGLDPQEVEAFLALVAAELESLAKENQALRDDRQRLEDELARLRAGERALHETMIAAQKASADMREAARKEAELALSQAELQAEKIVQSAHQRYLRVVDDLAEAKRQRAQFEASLRALVAGHLKLLDEREAPAPGAGVEHLGAKKAPEGG